MSQNVGTNGKSCHYISRSSVCTYGIVTSPTNPPSHNKEIFCEYRSRICLCWSTDRLHRRNFFFNPHKFWKFCSHWHLGKHVNDGAAGRRVGTCLADKKCFHFYLLKLYFDKKMLRYWVGTVQPWKDRGDNIWYQVHHEDGLRRIAWMEQVAPRTK